MKKATVKVTLSDKNSVLQEWQHSCQTDVPELFEAVKQIKESVNNYLTHLINQDKNNYLKDQLELAQEYEMEEEVEAESFSGFMKNLATDNENFNRNQKMKINYLHQAKKIKK